MHGWPINIQQGLTVSSGSVRNRWSPLAATTASVTSAFHCHGSSNVSALLCSLHQPGPHPAESGLGKQCTTTELGHSSLQKHGADLSRAVKNNKWKVEALETVKQRHDSLLCYWRSWICGCRAKGLVITGHLNSSRCDAVYGVLREGGPTVGVQYWWRSRGQ